MLLHELESLKKQLITGREKELSELKNNSTQTQVVVTWIDFCCSDIETQ